jgi:hypothetical protein
MSDTELEGQEYAYSEYAYLRIQALLYLLMRDHLPTGNVVKLIRELPIVPTEATYTSHELQSYAARLALEVVGTDLEEST